MGRGEQAAAGLPFPAVTTRPPQPLPPPSPNAHGLLSCPPRPGPGPGSCPHRTASPAPRCWLHPIFTLSCGATSRETSLTSGTRPPAHPATLTWKAPSLPRSRASAPGISWSYTQKGPRKIQSTWGPIGTEVTTQRSGQTFRDLSGLLLSGSGVQRGGIWPN